MNLLFWNLGKKDNHKYVENIIVENSIDIALFSEFSGTDMEQVVSTLKGDYYLCNGNHGCDKIIMIAREGIQVTVCRESTRYATYICDLDSCQYIICGVHLPSNPHSNSDDRKRVARQLIEELTEDERRNKKSKAIIIGDFNASPFDSELIQKTAFNSVLYKELIQSHEYVTIEGKKYRRFYNPALNYISEESGNYGSYYYSPPSDSLYWFCYDQILVRRSLSNAISNIQYCKSINAHSLMKAFKPNASISDHLPLIARIERTETA